MASSHKMASQVGPNRYDAVVRIELLGDAYVWNKGWTVTTEPSSDPKLEFCTAVRVSPIGKFNVGKTWLIRKLCGTETMDLASGADVHTEGFSLKMASLLKDSRQCVFLDTAGLNSPVNSVAALGAMMTGVGSDKMRAMQSMLEELRRQETFIRHVGFEFAQVFLVVVGQMSHSDQLELLQLIELAEKQTKQRKQVLVVHNLKTMDYESFAERKDENTGMTYLESMEQVFKLSHRDVEIAGPGSEVKELYGAFGHPLSRVEIRHVFLTREADRSKNEVPDVRCRNHYVFEHIRIVIQSTLPATGNVMVDLAKIMTECAGPLVRLSGGKHVEIRYHQERKRLVAGWMPEEQRKAENEAAEKAIGQDADLLNAEKAAVEAAAVVQAKGKDATPAEVEAAALADQALSEARVLIAGKLRATTRDAKDLRPLGKDDTVSFRPIALGATSATSATHVTYNVARVRGYVGGQPFWIALVHLNLPGLKLGDLQKIREVMRWHGEEPGLVMEQASPQSPETLKIRFTATLLSTPSKQVESLNTQGQASQGPGRGAIQITQVSSIVEGGSRPFSSGTSGEHETKVLIHTGLQNCTWEIDPVLSYGRGILTIAVACTVSDVESALPENQTWYNGTPSLMPLEEVKGMGSEDDVDA